ncbi:MAG: alpha/beta hydrolase [Gemmatimonadetes bacterium]|nr:alpha/beta hydrolase [Gemmatimonadota bacterium]
MIRRYGLAIGAAAALLTLTALGAYYLRNPERETLDAEARTAAGVPGEFIGSPVGTTYYEVAGPDTGRVALLVHGFSVPSYIWDSTFTSLAAAGYRVIRYDLMGRGWSDRPDAAYDGPMFDAQILALLDSLGVRGTVDLFGLSFGGFVTAHFTAAHGDRVRTLVLVDPIVEGPTDPGFLAWPLVGRYVFQVTAVPGMADGQASDFLHPERFPGWVDRYRPQMRYRGFGRALLRSRLTLVDADFAALHGRIAAQGTPVMLAWGKQDATLPFAQSEIVRGRIPALEFVPIDSSGHLPHLEQTRTFNAAMFAFLARHLP